LYAVTIVIELPIDREWYSLPPVLSLMGVQLPMQSVIITTDVVSSNHT